METNNAKLFAKIAKVMATVRTLEKDGRNQFDKYDYVTADAIATRIGKVMADVGLAFLPSLVSVETSEYTTKSGGSNFRTVAHFQMTLACTETGATWSSLWSGEAIDRSDKSISKAAVSAVKYYLLKTFLLAGGDEEDADASSPAIDNPFEQPTKPRATPAQVTQLDKLGKAFYQGEWQEQRAKLSKAVSKGNASEPEELLASEIATLIAGIEKKRAQLDKVAA